jgi:hypothetical protein
MNIVLPNAELKPTAIPGKFIGWREKNGAFQPIAVTVSESAPYVTGNVETTNIKVEVLIMQDLNPAQMSNTAD